MNRPHHFHPEWPAEGFSDPQPETNPGIPRQWVSAVPNCGDGLVLVRFTDETETAIEVCVKVDGRWSPGYPGVPA